MPRKRRFDPNVYRDDITETGAVSTKPSRPDQSPADGPPISTASSRPRGSKTRLGGALEPSEDTISRTVRVRIKKDHTEVVEALSNVGRVPVSRIYSLAAKSMGDQVEALAQKFDTAKLPPAPSPHETVSIRITVRMDQTAHDKFMREHDPLGLSAKSAPFNAWALCFFDDALKTVIQDLQRRI